MQHGLALSKEENPERPLSDTGISQTSAIASQLGKMEVSPSNIYHSGKLRARQTAEIIAANATGASQNINQHSHMAPNDDVRLLIPELANKTLYVGHLPYLDKLCSYLLTGHESAGLIQFQNSGVICLKLANEQYQLAWYLTADMAVAWKSRALH